MAYRPDKFGVNDPDYGRWLPSYESLPTGTPESATSPYRDMLQNHTYNIYTTPRPYDWYVYGFAINTTAVQVVSITVQVSTDEEEENLSLRVIDAGAVLGWPVDTPEPGETCQINSHWLPLPAAHCFGNNSEAWAWFDMGNDDGVGGGAAAWFRSGQCRVERPPYRVASGKQLRFIISNRFTLELPDVCVTIVGVRWLPWGGDVPARKVISL